MPSPHGDDAVVTLRRREHREAADVLVDSHGDYPAFRYVFPAGRRRRALRPFLEATVRDACSSGVVDAVRHEGRIAGVAVWLPPGGYPWSPRRQVLALPAMLRTALAAPASFRTFAALGAHAAAAHPRDRHWYLVALGVRHEFHGRGLGSALLAPGLRRADADRLDVYVETSDPANLPFYARYGFAVVEPALQLLPGGPPYAALRRPTSSA
jgi:GNAT superfamily N-acetyltransferase